MNTIAASTTCKVCGKPLTDPISISLGVGPVCRISDKLAVMKDQTGNLFESVAKYDYGFDNRILWIEDLGGMKSVTNDMENVLNTIASNHGIDSLTDYKIMYKDSQGIWDGVSLEEKPHTLFGRQVKEIINLSFFPITEREFTKAKEKLISMK
jgi:hypothetical protein